MKYVTYGVRELQANLGDALRAARRGERVIITSRNKAVALLTRIDAELPDEPAIERKLRRMAAQGRIRIGDPSPIPLFKPMAIGGLARQLLADRR
jgi:prevent-host-death family protein